MKLFRTFVSNVLNDQKYQRISPAKKDHREAIAEPHENLQLEQVLKFALTNQVSIAFFMRIVQCEKQYCEWFFERSKRDVLFSRKNCSEQ